MIDPKTNKPVAIGDAPPDFEDSSIQIPAAAWTALKTFQPASYFAVAM